MEKQKESHSQNDEQSKYYRFRVVQDCNPKKDSKERNVGMAYLTDGQDIFTLRLWMFNNERFYVVASRNEPSKYLVMTRELNKNPTVKNKYHWNFVGSGKPDTTAGYIRIDFDLLEKPVYMSIHPEPHMYSTKMTDQEAFDEAA